MQRSGIRVLHALNECLRGAALCRFFIALPTQYIQRTPAWRELHAHITHTLAEGWNPTARCDITYTIACNQAAANLWPINNALLVAHLGPILRAMRIHIQHIPHSMRIQLEPGDVPTQYSGRATDPPLPGDANGKKTFWAVWNAELKLREGIMQQKPLNWRQLLQSYQRMNAMMPYAPLKHLRRLSKLIDWNVSDQLANPRQWVYMVWTVLDP